MYQSRFPLTPEGEHRILAIDPGVTTGIAFALNGKVVWTDTAIDPWDDLRNTLHIHTARGATVVCERGPTFERHHRDVLEQVERIVLEEAENVHWVVPGQWKGTPPSRGAAIKGTQHEKDAAGLARWFYNTQGVKDGQDGSRTRNTS